MESSITVTAMDAAPPTPLQSKASKTSNVTRGVSLDRRSQVEKVQERFTFDDDVEMEPRKEACV